MDPKQVIKTEPLKGVMQHEWSCVKVPTTNQI